ncbi:MAG: hypothetical protein ABSG24_07165 [Acidimicrobiales bacterium]
MKYATTTPALKKTAVDRDLEAKGEPVERIGDQEGAVMRRGTAVRLTQEVQDVGVEEPAGHAHHEDGARADEEPLADLLEVLGQGHARLGSAELRHRSLVQ